MSQGYTDQMRGDRGIRVARDSPEPTFADLVKLANEGGNLLSVHERRIIVDRIRAVLDFRPIDWSLVDMETAEHEDGDG